MLHPSRLADEYPTPVIPEGNGSVLVDDPHNLPPPPPINHDPELEVPMERFSLTVFHQLHCLRGIPRASDALVRDLASEPVPAPVNHRPDCLREGVMCCDDTALTIGQLQLAGQSERQRLEGRGSEDFNAVLAWANIKSSQRKLRGMREAENQGKGGSEISGAQKQQQGGLSW